jgi:hypothetical protein
MFNVYSVDGRKVSRFLPIDDCSDLWWFWEQLTFSCFIFEKLRANSDLKEAKKTSKWSAVYDAPFHVVQLETLLQKADRKDTHHQSNHNTHLIGTACVKPLESCRRPITKDQQ